MSMKAMIMITMNSKGGDIIEGQNNIGKEAS